MKKIFVTCLLAMTMAGCAGTVEYGKVIKAPAPPELAGVWMSTGPQSALVSPEAIASLIITRSGDTLDCRQWQRTIARRGELHWRSGTLYNVNEKNENNEVSLAGGVLHYDRLTLQRVATPTVECQAYLTKVNGEYTLRAAPAAAPAAPHSSKSHKKSGVQMRNSKD